MRKRYLALVAAISLVGAAPAAGSHAAEEEGPQAIASHRCKGGRVHAVLPWGHKCLQRGQFCKRGQDRRYHRYGFHCHASGRLT